ncbi:MAG TPA: DJ-1/PfpI family protein [Terracidiphilus sp.]|nr:DJ-1/PfpI family protein [Terracidiphilus sp.]
MDHPEHLRIGALVFPEMDQIDLTGPFEVLSRLPDSKFHLLWKAATPVRDLQGLILTPEMSIAEAPPLDLLVVPGGWGQERLMEDEAVLGFIRRHAVQGGYIFSVCTGALICGAAGVLRGVKCTTHWAAFHLLKYFGAIPMEARVVIDGKHVSAAGVTAGIDGALRVASLLRGREIAEQIQLSIEYAPEPPFSSGTPQTASAEVLHRVQASYRQITERRIATARRYAQRFGIETV